ncbi:MAG: hypothetical protein NVSMB1_08400 [Polyangiales bacterium]
MAQGEPVDRGAPRFDEEDVVEVMRHLDRLTDRYRELQDLETTLRDALRAVRRTRSELRETLNRLDYLDAERADGDGRSQDKSDEVAGVDSERPSDSRPSVRKALPADTQDANAGASRLLRGRAR